MSHKDFPEARGSGTGFALVSSRGDVRHAGCPDRGEKSGKTIMTLSLTRRSLLKAGAAAEAGKAAAAEASADDVADADAGY